MTDLKRRMRAGETLIGAFSDLASPLGVELLGNAGLDWIVLDLEHGSATEADLLGLLHAVATTPAAAIVRPQSGERLRIGRALDLGAAGIMIPQMQSADDVRVATSYLRYPPVGSRGVALRTRGAGMGALGHGDLARVVNERVVGIVQIESPNTAADADAIAALDEVDCLFVGPADLSHALGIPGQFDDPAYLGRAAGRRGGVPRPRQGGRHPHLRRRRPGTPPRPRVHVRRARFRRGVRLERGSGDAGGGGAHLTHGVAPATAWPDP